MDIHSVLYEHVGNVFPTQLFHDFPEGQKKKKGTTKKDLGVIYRISTTVRVMVD